MEQKWPLFAEDHGSETSANSQLPRALPVLGEHGEVTKGVRVRFGAGQGCERNSPIWKSPCRSVLRGCTFRRLRDVEDCKLAGVTVGRDVLQELTGDVWRPTYASTSVACLKVT